MQEKIEMKQNEMYGINRSECGISTKSNVVYGIKREEIYQNDGNKNRPSYDYVDVP